MGCLQIKMGIVKDGKQVSSCKYDDIKPIFAGGKEINNVFQIVQDEKLGLIHIREKSDGGNSKFIGLHEICHVSEKYLIATINDERYGIKYGLIRLPYLSELAPFTFDYAEVLDDDLIIVKKDGLYGVINNSGQYVLATSFKNIEYDRETKMFKSEFYMG